MYGEVKQPKEPEFSIAVKTKSSAVKAEVRDRYQGILAFQGIYEEGDRICIGIPEANRFYKIRIDDTMDDELVYLTVTELIYEIPFGEKKKSYNKKSFAGDRHYLTVRSARPYEINCYRNLAKNVIDQHGERGCFPHASANVETRGESVFAARNAIDGVIANRSHGSWPYESWGINRDDQAEMKLEFGRKVDIDQLILYTRADFPHDNWWVSATVTFSDGERKELKMEKSVRPHSFAVQKTGIEWVTLSGLVKSDDPSPFPALTQLEIYGTESAQDGKEKR